MEKLGCVLFGWKLPVSRSKTALGCRVNVALKLKGFRPLALYRFLPLRLGDFTRLVVHRVCHGAVPSNVCGAPLRTGVKEK